MIKNVIGKQMPHIHQWDYWQQKSDDHEQFPIARIAPSENDHKFSKET